MAVEAALWGSETVVTVETSQSRASRLALFPLCFHSASYRAMLKLWRTAGIAAVRSTARTPCPACHSRALSSSSSLSASTTRATSIPPPSIDLAPLLNDPDKVKQNLVDRKYPLGPEVVDEIQSLEMDSRRLKRDIQRIRERRNAVSGFPPAAKPGSAAPGSTGGPSEASLVKTRLKALTLELSTITTRLSHLSLQLPNTSSPSSPIGSESAAVIVHTLGPSISSPPPPAQPLLDHLRLSSPSHLAWTDFPSSSLITGASWSLLTNEGALLEMALTQYAFAKTIAHGFSPVLTPDVVRSDIADRCGFRPRDGEAQQTYFLEDGTKEPALCLVGTAEVPLVAMSAAMVFEEDKLPLKQVALGRAFRAEAGARGADSRGLYRVHQFSKVEMVVVCKQEDSDGILEDLRGIQEDILGDLGLSLRYVPHFLTTSTTRLTVLQCIGYADRGTGSFCSSQVRHRRLDARPW